MPESDSDIDDYFYHVPKPDNSDGICDVEGEWGHLNKLLTNDRVAKVICTDNQQNNDLRDECARYKAALEIIANPIQYLQNEVAKEGCSLNGGMAAQIGNDPGWLKNEAKKALNIT